MSLDRDTLAGWVGREQRREDRITASPAASLAALLDREEDLAAPGWTLPPLWHWAYFLPAERQSMLDEDGHARRGDFLPPVPLPRRMWAGGRLDFHRPLRIGDAARRVSRIASVEPKAGRTGPLVFVAVTHEVSTAGGPAVTERHDIVYRGPAAPGSAAPQPVPAGAAWRREIRPDPVLLFRYSAVTFNGHRIHSDRDYVTRVEGYPGLVVHGPLIATLLVDLLRRERPEAVLERFTYRAVGPLFDTAPFFVCGDPDKDGRTVRLWAADAAGNLATEAEAVLAGR